jgi:hypothetical protein
MLFGIGRVLSISEDNKNNSNLSSRPRAHFYTPCDVSYDVRFTPHQGLPMIETTGRFNCFTNPWLRGGVLF